MSIIDKKNPILIDIPMPIETPRLIIRNALPGDGRAVYAAKKDSFAELHNWMPWAKELGTEDETEAALRKAHAQFLIREDLMMVGFCKENGEVVVCTGLHRMNWDLRIFEIGYWVRTPYTGKGYASESANALIRFAFDFLKAGKVTIAHAEGNDASARVIEKLGFVKEGVFKKDARLPDGTITDHHWYARFDTNGLPELDVKWGQP